MSNILVVDDSATMRHMVQAALRGVPSLTYAEAGNGLEAIEQLALAAIDLMICDLNMPDMHGLELIQFLRGQQTLRALPIVVLTTRADEASRAAVLAAGASEYLTKPFRPDVLAAHVRRLLNRA